MNVPAPASGPEERLRELGWHLPAAPMPFGAYAPVVLAGGLAYLSGMAPVVNAQPAFIGIVGDSLTVEQGAEAARLAAMNALATLQRGLGTLRDVAGVVRLAVSIRAGRDFAQHPRVADGASRVFNDVFGPGHARLVFGVTSLPAGMCVELEVIARLATRTDASRMTLAPT